MRTALSISRLHQAAVQAVHFTPITWQGPASYGLTDSMGRMHGDAQFAGSSSVPAHVEMMGLIGMGNNPMVGATVAVAVSIEEAANAGKVPNQTAFLIKESTNLESTVVPRAAVLFLV